MINKFIKTLKWLFTKRTIVLAEYDFKNEVMRIEYSNGDVDKYSGACTVWRRLPSMKRCGTMRESFLCDLYKYIKKYGTYMR